MISFLCECLYYVKWFRRHILGKSLVVLWWSYGWFFLYQGLCFVPEFVMIHPQWLVGRSFLTPLILWRALYCMYHLFWDFVLPLSHFFVALFLWLNVGSCHIQYVIMFDDIMDLNLLSLGTLVPTAPCCISCNKILMTWFLLVLWFDLTHRQTHTRTHGVQ